MYNEKILQVKKIQKYIKANIKNQITLSDISKHINYSLWYSARIFKEVVGMSIFTYIRKMRLTHAAKVLRDTNSKVIDVAFDFVFDSHEGFTRAFSKEFSVNPKEYQKSPIPLPYFIPFEITEKKMKGKIKRWRIKLFLFKLSKGQKEKR